MFMKNKKTLLTTLILFLVLVEASTLFLMYKSYSGKETNLDEVNLQENLTNEMFAIMLEQDDGTYKESSDNTWPTSGYTYNASMSGCIDVNGNKLDGVLTYDATNNIATVDTGNTSYCYLYFSLPLDNLYKLCKNYSNIDDCIKNDSDNISYITDIWDSTLEDDGYRYIGTNPANYVCFGTTDKTTCTGNTDMYMYRIIGIFEDADGNQHMKLIKKESLNTSYKWHESSDDVDWDESDLYSGINGSYFLTNTAFQYMQDTNWIDKITEWNYTATNTLSYENYTTTKTKYGIFYYYNTPKSIYLHELNRNGKSNQTCNYNVSTIADCNAGEWKEVPSKIGLMYASDYSLSLGTKTLDSLINSNYNTMKTGWIHLSNNDSATLSTTTVNPPSPLEWILPRVGTFAGGLSHAYYLDTNGSILNKNVDLTNYAVRPVFYLTSDVKITGGDGSSSNPYIIG